VYKQGTGSLTRAQTGLADKDCCLGVLCKLAVEAGAVTASRKPAWVTTEEDGKFSWSVEYGEFREHATLPPEVREWAGLTQSNPNIKFNPAGPDESAAHLNDTGTSFADIADLIDANL
jgi:hypothetical protein